MELLYEVDDGLLRSGSDLVRVRAEAVQSIGELYVTDLEVNEDDWGDGVGSRVIADLEEYAAEKMDGTVTIVLRFGNRGPAKEFLIARGFRGISEEDNGRAVQATKQV